MTVGPLPLPGRTGVRITGDFYQWLLVWQGCVIALHHQAQRARNPIIAVGVEADDAGNLDDIIWWRETPAHSYFQAKFAVDSSTPINTDYLTSLSSSGGPSILRKIALAWLDLSGGGAPVDLAIVTNRAPDPTDVLLTGRDGRTKLLLPRAAQQGRSSRRGRARGKWAKESGLNEAQLLAMLSVLRFETARDLTDVEEKTSLLMRVAGLRGDLQAVRDGANWVAQQVRDGRQRIDLDMIHEALKELNLREGPSRAVLSVATLKPDPLADQAVHTLDWFERFHGADAYSKRRPEPPATWQQLQEDIEAIPRHLGNVSQVALTGSVRQATAFAIGAALRMVTNVDLAVMQRDQLWASNDGYDAPVEPVVKDYELTQGNDLALAIEISTPMTEDVLEYLRAQQIPVARLVVLRPSAGPKDNAIADANAANALAVGIRNQARRSARGHGRVHLFLAGPMGLSLLLGHRWNRVAQTVVYEEVLGTTQYEAAFTVSA